MKSLWTGKAFPIFSFSWEMLMVLPKWFFSVCEHLSGSDCEIPGQHSLLLLFLPRLPPHIPSAGTVHSPLILFVFWKLSFLLLPFLLALGDSTISPLVFLPQLVTAELCFPFSPGEQQLCTGFLYLAIFRTPFLFCLKNDVTSALAFLSWSQWQFLTPFSSWNLSCVFILHCIFKSTILPVSSAFCPVCQIPGQFPIIRMFPGHRMHTGLSVSEELSHLAQSPSGEAFPHWSPTVWERASD